MAGGLERYETRITRWGNSQGVRIPRELCEKLGIVVGDAVSIEYESGTLKVTPLRDGPRFKRGGYRSLEELFAGYDGDFGAEEAILGTVGAEELPPYEQDTQPEEGVRGAA